VNEESKVRPEQPTKEQLRANNRDARLEKGWAHKCSCGRKFTTVSGIESHLINYHGVRPEDLPSKKAG
jgi:hypothetical protein